MKREAHICFERHSYASTRKGKAHIYFEIEFYLLRPVEKGSGPKLSCGRAGSHRGSRRRLPTVVPCAASPPATAGVVAGKSPRGGGDCGISHAWLLEREPREATAALTRQRDSDEGRVEARRWAQVGGGATELAGWWRRRRGVRGREGEETSARGLFVAVFFFLYKSARITG